MMYLGNSRILQGRSSNNVVYGEWKAVAPNGASGGYYGAVGNAVGTTVNVVAMEWSEIHSTLIFGGLFDNIINGNINTLEQANSLGIFDGTDIKNLPPTYQGGVTGVAFGSSFFNGRVYDIREIKHSTTHYTFLIVGAFSSDGVTSYSSTTDLHSIAQYSLENNEWIPFGSGLYRYGVDSSSNYSAIRISNLLSDSTGVTAYIFGDFQDIRYENNNNQFSLGAVCYRYNDTAPSGGHTAQLIACGGSLDPANQGGVYWTAGHFRNGANGDGKLYLSEGNAQIISVFDTPQSPSTISHVENIDVSSITNLDPIYTYAPIIDIQVANLDEGLGLLSFLERSTVNDNYLYLTGNPVLISTQTSPSTDVDFQVLNTQLIGIESVSSFYNSGYHLPTVKGEIDNGKAILFYNTDTGSFKNVILPEGLDNIYCMAIASDETIYVGGLFQFQDSDGNTACSIAKFVPDASKLP